MAKLARHLEGLHDGERQSRQRFFDIFDAGKDKLEYRSNRHQLLDPRQTEELIVTTFVESTGRELVSADYGVTGCKFDVLDDVIRPKGAWSSASFWANYQFEGPDPSFNYSLALTMGKRPLQLLGGEKLKVCVNEHHWGSQQHAVFSQTASLATFLPTLVAHIADESAVHYQATLDMRDAMLEIDLTDAGCARLLGEMLVQRSDRGDKESLLGLMPENVVKKVAEDMRTPQHAEFMRADGTRTLWTALQATNYWTRFVAHQQRGDAAAAVSEFFRPLVESRPSWLSA